MEREKRKGFLFEPIRKEGEDAEDRENLRIFLQDCARPTRMDNTFWCTCRNCSCMSTDIENICCRENSALSDKLDAGVICKTNSSSFFKLCLDKEVLEVLIFALKDFIGESTIAQLTSR